MMMPLLWNYHDKNGNQPNAILSDDLFSNDDQVDFDVQYIRTPRYAAREIEYPLITFISSKEELENYYEKYKDTYDFKRRNTVPGDFTIGFLDAIDKYTEDWFDNCFIVIVLLEERSGSIRHTVEKVDETGKIYIKKLIPQPMTEDLAAWNIIIEITNEFLPDDFTVSFSD